MKNDLDRRGFIGKAAAGSLVATGAVFGQEEGAVERDVPEGAFTAGSDDGPVFAGSPVVSGPSHRAISILQPLQRFATGYLEFAIAGGDFQRVEADNAVGLRPFEEHVLKFNLPPLPAGKEVTYRVIAHSVGWVRVRQFHHGQVKAGEEQTSEARSFRTLDPSAESTTFAVWNDTHENAETLKALHGKTTTLKPDFLLWNGDQTNDVHFEKDMADQFISPAGLSLADWPLAYVRGNHDVRGPAAKHVPRFTGTPRDRYYYAFRSGPVASLVMDTGEDKPDDSIYFGGMAAFQPMQQQQLEWLRRVSNEPWFRGAPFKILFCHIPLYSKRDIFPSQKRWEHHSFCQRLWEAALVEAGVKLIVSGHTHSSDWRPANDGQAIAQLIGGAPQTRFATFIKGEATLKKLAIEMSKLDGETVAKFEIEAG